MQRLVHDPSLHPTLLEAGAPTVLPPLLADEDLRTAMAAARALNALILNRPTHDALVSMGLFVRLLQQVAAAAVAHGAAEVPNAAKVAVDESLAIRHSAVVAAVLGVIASVCQCVLPHGPANVAAMLSRAVVSQWCPWPWNTDTRLEFKSWYARHTSQHCTRRSCRPTAPRRSQGPWQVCCCAWRPSCRCRCRAPPWLVCSTTLLGCWRGRRTSRAGGASRPRSPLCWLPLARRRRTWRVQPRRRAPVVRAAPAPALALVPPLTAQCHAVVVPEQRERRLLPCPVCAAGAG